jgi:glycosyltransferase involved in cell wall biosynthesis
MRPWEGARVTFIVPCYNSTEWQHECLHSLVMQSVTAWEAVVVDDGSTDAAAIARIAEGMRDNRIRVIRHAQNRGPSAARNTGIAAARTEFVVCVDSDDRLVPDHLEQTLGAASDRGADAVFGDYQYFGASSELVRTRVPSPTEILLRMPLHSSGMLMKKSLWERLGGFDEADPLRLGREDIEFYIRLFSAGANVIHVDKVLYLCRIWEESLNRRCLRNEHIPRFYIYTKHRRLYELAGVRNTFLTKGFEIAGRTALLDGKRLRAAVMAARSLRYGGSVKTLILFLETIMPLPAGAFANLRRRIGVWIAAFRHVTHGGFTASKGQTRLVDGSDGSETGK